MTASETQHHRLSGCQHRTTQHGSPASVLFSLLQWKIVQTTRYPVSSASVGLTFTHQNKEARSN